MKRLISYLSSWHSLLLMLMMLTVTACVDDNDDTEAPYLEVSPTSLTFGEDGKPTADSQDYFEVKTNRPWKITVQDDATWLTLSKTTGDGDAQISVSVPAGTSGTAKVDVQIVNSSGVLMSETVTVKCFGADEPIVPDTPTAVIFNETVGDDASASDKPFVDAYTGWKKTGEGAANVTYGSSGKVSVRNSGLSNSGAYEGASGPNVVFFGTAPTTFYINKIALTSEQTKLKLTFGASYSYKNDAGEYVNTFDTSLFKVSVSKDGSKWIPVTYTKNKGDETNPYWVLATADFTLKQAATELYIKFETEVSSAIRLDDITLATGEGGQEVDFEAAVEPTPSASVIFNETVGDDASASDKPYVDAYTGWKKTGEGAANVTYGLSGKVSVRNSGLSNSGAYEGASGPNVVFFGTAPTTFYINKIALTSEQTKLKLTFGASYSYKNDAGEYVNTFDTSLFKVSVSKDGSKWIPVTYTKNKGDETNPYWVLATADFTLKQAATELYIKFDTEVSSAIRLDDITLATGEGGQEVDFEAVPDTPTPSDKSAIATLLEMYAAGTTALSADMEFEAIVSGDPKGGNFSYGTLYIMTEGATTGGEGITLYNNKVDVSANYALGDKVKVSLKAANVTLGAYNGITQITGWEAADVVVVSSGHTVTPIEITPAQMAEYYSMPVTIKNVTTAEGGTWKESGSSSNMKTQFTVNGEALVIYLNKNATDFDGLSYKATTGSLTGIVGAYKSTPQLLPRNVEDVAAFMEGSSDTPSEKSAIATLLEMYAAGTTALSADMEFEAIVSGDPKGGNFSYGTLYIMTEGATTGGEGITLYNNKVDVSANYALGDKVKVSLKAANVTLGAYNGITQITGWEAADVVVVSSGHTVTPIEITPAQMAEYYSMPVTIKNVTTAEGGTWKESGSSSNMKTQFTVNGEALVIYLNKNATGFDGLSYKATTGSLTGIVGAYKSTPQLLPRNVEDAADFMDNGSTEEPDPTPDTPSTEATYESIAAFNFANGTNVGSASEADIIIGESTFKGVKLGTSKKAGTFTSAAVGVTGDKTLSFYAVAWKGKTATLYVRVDNGGEVSGTNSFALTANEGASNNTPYTITFAGSDYYSVSLKGLTENSTITISTTDTFDDASSSAGRAVMCGFQLK